MKNELTKEVQQAIKTLGLNPDQADYLRKVIYIAYLMGERKGFIQGTNLGHDSINRIGEALGIGEPLGVGEALGINLGHELAGGLTNPSY